MYENQEPARIVAATTEHARAMRLRASDLREVNLWAPGKNPSDVLQLSVATGDAAYAAIGEDGEVVAIGGFSVDGNVVSPWLIAADSLQRHRKQLMRHSKTFLEGLLRDFPGHVLGNHVNRDNKPARSFLRALGAVIVPTPGRADFDFFFFPRDAAA